MKTRIVLGAAAAAALAFTLSACTVSGAQPSAPPTDVIAPVTMDAGDLQGATVDLVVGQMLYIDTGDLSVESYRGTVADPAIAEFIEGIEDAHVSYTPGVRALAEGSTDVELTNEQGGIQPLEFTVQVADG